MVCFVDIGGIPSNPNPLCAWIISYDSKIVIVRHLIWNSQSFNKFLFKIFTDYGTPAVSQKWLLVVNIKPISFNKLFIDFFQVTEFDSTSSDRPRTSTSSGKKSRKKGKKFKIRRKRKKSETKKKGNKLEIRRRKERIEVRRNEISWKPGEEWQRGERSGKEECKIQGAVVQELHYCQERHFVLLHKVV